MRLDPVYAKFYNNVRDGGSMGTREEKLQELGITLPTAGSPAANYANFFIVGGLLFVSGKGPSGGPRGKLGIDYTTEEGYQFARSAAIEVLAVLKEAVGSLDAVKRAVKVQGFVNAGPEFSEHHIVINGYSDLINAVFSESGGHARSVLGAVSLRNQLPVVVDAIFELYPAAGGDFVNEDGHRFV